MTPSEELLRSIKYQHTISIRRLNTIEKYLDELPEGEEAEPETLSILEWFKVLIGKCLRGGKHSASSE